MPTTSATSNHRWKFRAAGSGCGGHLAGWRLRPLCSRSGNGGGNGGRKSRLEPPVPAHARAKQMLEKALELIAQPKPFCILVSDTIRVYLEERFDFHAPERTTEEFLHELQGTDLLSAEQKEKLGEFLGCCDLVKFAKYEPGEPELRDLHGSALRLVEETEPRPVSESPALDPRPSTLGPVSA